MKNPSVYLLASARRGTLYTGVTSNLSKRVWQHRTGLVSGFTAQYGVGTLVWYEHHPTMVSAIAREKAIKKWRRQWKLELVEATNPEWQDLWDEIVAIAPTELHTTCVITVVSLPASTTNGSAADGFPLSRE